MAANLAALHPNRVSSLVLVDGGLPMGRPGEPAAAGGIDTDMGPAAARPAMSFPTRQAYRGFWHSHPAMGQIWGPEVEAYVDYDLIGEPPELHSSCVADAMRVDAAEVADHASVAATLRQISAPISFLRAERGFLDQPPALYPEDQVAVWVDQVKRMRARTVTDTNHYSILMGAAGATAVALAVADAVLARETDQ